MTSKRTFYRSVFQVEVISEHPYGQEGEGKSLADIAYDIEDGGENGTVSTLVENEQIDARRAAELLIESGSDPEYFGITEGGEDA